MPQKQWAPASSHTDCKRQREDGASSQAEGHVPTMIALRVGVTLDCAHRQFDARSVTELLGEGGAWSTNRSGDFMVQVIETIVSRTLAPGARQDAQVDEPTKQVTTAHPAPRWPKAITDNG